MKTILKIMDYTIDLNFYDELKDEISIVLTYLTKENDFCKQVCEHRIFKIVN